MPTFNPPQAITHSPPSSTPFWRATSTSTPCPLVRPPGEKHDAAPAPGSEAGHAPQTSLPWTLPGRHHSPSGLCRPGGYHPCPQGEGCGASVVCGGGGGAEGRHGASQVGCQSAWCFLAARPQIPFTGWVCSLNICFLKHLLCALQP